MKQTFTLIFALLLCSFLTSAQNAVKNEIDAFAAKTGAVPTIDKATNALSFLRFPGESPLKVTGDTPRDKAVNFLRQNLGLFSAKREKDSYFFKETRKDNYGFEHVTVQQFFQGIPVYDGIMKLHFSAKDELTSINGNSISVDKLSTVPAITEEEAARIAIKLVTGQQPDPLPSPLKVYKNNLTIFQKGLAQGYKGPLHLVYEIEVRNAAGVREFLFIDAHTSLLVEQFTGTHAIDRKLYETSVNPANLKWQESDGTAGATFSALDQWQKSEVESSEHIYTLMKNSFGYTSYNGANASMITINNNPSISCPNANWNGTTANYCTGTATDDVVAHEWAHAYTEYTSGLIYAWQAGAMNEAYSDIWGETVDQLNGYMDAGESSALRTGCSSSDRWRVGEKATAFGGAIRDMWDPTCNGDPGKVSDSQYWCASSDAGGVHTNSGVLNHVYALLVDGGTYNGQTITGLGITKAAHIFWRAQFHYMTQTTDFAAQADILEASLNDLIGINLLALNTGTSAPVLSGQILSVSDAQQLAKVISAMELRADNNCGFATLLQPVPALCGPASAGSAIFYAEFEAGLGSFTVSNTGVSGTWIPRNWALNSTPPNGRTGKVLYGVDYLGGNCSTSLQNGVISVNSPAIVIPAALSGPFYMAFDHYISMESGWDGGNISYKIGSGAWTKVPGSAFTANGYNATMKTLAEGNNNPMQGQSAFTGADGGSVAGSWGQSRIDLSSLGLVAGQNIQFRWDLGTDGCNGWDGWYIDDVRVYTCAMPSVQFDLASSSANEGEATLSLASPNNCLKYIEKTIRIKINSAPTQPVTVTFNAITGTATQGATSDFTITPNTFTLQSGTLFKDVTVRIYDDAYVEGPETFTLSYSLTNSPGGNAYPETVNQNHTITIVDNDFTPGVISYDLLSENFNGNVMPAGWNVVGGGSYPSTWGVVQNTNALDPNGQPYLFINSDAAGVGAMDKSVESAPFNSVGMTSINLSFIEYFHVYTSGTEEKGFVDVWDGSGWQNLLTQSQTTGNSGSWATPATRNIVIPVAYANPAMKIRFRYLANWDWGWAVDNVKIVASGLTRIQDTETVVGDVQYLGPNATAYFYAPTSKNLIAKIKNLGTHDYGCTTVAVDRAGNDETAWGAYHVTNKTFKVTPTYNNPSGSHEITLYYKTTELPTFNGLDIKSMGKTSASIGSSSFGSATFAVVQASSVLGTDLAYTSTFNSGFSGFGLSDFTVGGGALPVSLVNFSGKHTSEGNLLSWETSSEINNNHFVIEKTFNGRNFEEIGQVLGNRTTALTNQYRFLETQIANGISYYRLKQVDLDGKYAYSSIIAIDTKNAGELKFFPNPVQSQLTMELPDLSLKVVNVQIVNSSGQQMFLQKNTKTNNGKVVIDVSKLPAGIYQIILSAEGTSYNVSVVKL